MVDRAGQRSRSERGHGWWPYWLPFFGFLVLIELGGRLPERAASVLLVLKVLVPGGIVLHYLRRGAYPELRSYPGGLRAVALDVLVGVAGAAVWMAPWLFVEHERLPGFMRVDPEWGFDPQQLGPSLVGLAIGLRLVGYALVTPIVEELFMRSWLMRFLDVVAGRESDFRQVPIARFSWPSFVGVLFAFTAGHVVWEWPVAIVWVVGTQLWFYRRRHLPSLVIVHAASNLSILLFVVAASGRWTDPLGNPMDLWFFL